MSAFARPLLSMPGGHVEILERVSLTSAGSDQISERWLQEILFASPESLPIREIDPHIGALIPVCMEIETGAGPADILYITLTGQIVLVETKLWRNPEARRAVVGQILDYAKQLTGWTYETLDQRAATAAKAKVGHLLRCARERDPQVDEAAFVDGVNRSLASGDFLLLLVGDGIRYGAESLVGFLERFGHLKFGLGLVEVAAFRLPDGSVLLQPRILAKTEVLQRTVLLSPTGPVTFQDAAMAEDATDRNQAQRDWFAQFWSEYLAVLNLDDASLVPNEPAKSTNQFFPMPPGGSKAWVSAFIAQGTGRAGVYLTFGRAYERADEMVEALMSDKEAIESELEGPLLITRQGDDKIYMGLQNFPFKDLRNDAERHRVIATLADMTQRTIRAFKPRLEAAVNTMS